MKCNTGSQEELGGRTGFALIRVSPCCIKQSFSGCAVPRYYKIAVRSYLSANIGRECLIRCLSE